MSEPIRVRDEVLEVMYWLKGEGIRAAVGPTDLRTFVDIDPDAAREHLSVLHRAGLLEAVDESSEPAYRLSERGEREAGRRFVESFAPYLGQGHGTACAPGCACESLDDPAVDCPTHGHRHVHQGGNG